MNDRLSVCFSLSTYEHKAQLEVYIDLPFIVLKVQLSWNYYFFIKNLYFDDKMEKLWTF